MHKKKVIENQGSGVNCFLRQSFSLANTFLVVFFAAFLGYVRNLTKNFLEFAML